ncbi:MAG: hypothetical protein NTX59_02895 [Elusimicrobia bacterium]|nr:hypothetical protein [Elusimicrobiota bacterium]
MKIEKRGRYWAVYADGGELICLAVYKKGAQEVLRRLEKKRNRPAPGRTGGEIKEERG